MAFDIIIHSLQQSSGISAIPAEGGRPLHSLSSYSITVFWFRKHRAQSRTSLTKSSSFMSESFYYPVLMMTMAAKCDSSTTFPLFAFRTFITPRRKISFLIVNKAESSFSNVKRANLAARKKDRVKLPNYNDGGGGKRIYHISEFLSHPSGIEAILNTSALQSFQFLDANLYRCTLPRVQLLNFEVAPVLDLRVTPTDEDCTVEMLSCKFVGSEVLERQNDHFSASMRNRITWDPNDTEPFLDVDVKLNLTLEIYTQPFTMLPISAVEGPGNLMMQTLLDRLVPLLVQQLLQDYSKWVQQQSRYLQ